MATKIDLLPRYVPLRRRLKKWTFAMATVWIAAIAFVAAVQIRQTAKLDVLTQNAADAKTRADQTRAIQAQTTTLNGDTTSADAVTFFVNAGKTGAQRATLIDQVRRYVLRSLKVDRINLSQGSTFSMEAAVPSRDEYANAIQVLRYAELDGVFTPGSTLGSGIQTFKGTPPEVYAAQTASAGAERIFPDRVNFIANLVNPVTEPTPPGGAVNGTAASGAPGAPTSSGAPGSPSAPGSSGSAPAGNPTSGPTR